jgi:hypothetical protein
MYQVYRQMKNVAHLLECDVWVIVVIAVELQPFYVGKGTKSWTGHMVVIPNTA